MMYDGYIMVRTQIYLSKAQERALSVRAKSDRTTKSALIRAAIDQYLDPAGGSCSRVENMHEAVRAAAGVAPYLPDGADYVDAIRSLDSERFEMLERRRGGSNAA